MTKILYHWFLLLGQIRFCETHFTTYQRFVADQSAISPFLGVIVEKFVQSSTVGCALRARWRRKASQARFSWSKRPASVSVFFTQSLNKLRCISVRSVAVGLVKARNWNRRPSRLRWLQKSKAPELIRVTDGSLGLREEIKCRKMIENVITSLFWIGTCVLGEVCRIYPRGSQCHTCLLLRYSRPASLRCQGRASA